MSTGHPFRKGKVICKGPPGGFRSGQVKRGHPLHRQARWRHMKVHMQALIGEGCGGEGSIALLPPPTGRPPLPPAELLRAQLAFATAAASEAGRAGPLHTSYPSLEALAAAGSALEGVGTSGGGEGVDTEEGDVISHRKRKGAGYDAAEELSETEGEGGSGDSRRDHGGRGHKKPRLVWTAELHARFMNAVTHLGVKHAAIQQQGHPPLFQHNMGAMPPGAGFPGFMPPPPGAAAGIPQLQWGPSPAGPPAAEGVPSSAEISAPMAGNPWFSHQQGGYGGAMGFPQMGAFGQPQGNFPGQEGPPGLPYGWVWGLAPPGGGGMVLPPGGLPPQQPLGKFDPSTAPSEPGPSAEHVKAATGPAAEGTPSAGGAEAAAEGGPSNVGVFDEQQAPESKDDAPT
ncbi:hypothetical protein WJX75_003133 [Coccomyxa subellipsoidea]|uniref:Uncharacterized protein n=1 Tax=Coccomyxa subellipsoidea TaxID=248742 RepID=A0ABR2Z082_9CHLO